MLKRNWALIALVYLAFAEVLSLAPVPDLSLCLIQPVHNEQAADHDEPKYCPAFHAGIEVFFASTNDVFEHYEKLIIGAFTIVLAVSTIGLWGATKRLWKAGEDQRQSSERIAERQRRSSERVAMLQRMSDQTANQSAIAAVRAANAANELNRQNFAAAQKAVILEQRPWLRWHMRVPPKLTKDAKRITATVDIIFENIGKTPALNVAYTARLYSVSNTEPSVTAGIQHLMDMAAEYTRVPATLVSIMPTEKTPLSYGPGILIDDLSMTSISEFPLYLAIHAAYRFFDGGTVAEVGSLYSLRAAIPTKTPEGGMSIGAGTLFHLDLFKNRPQLPTISMELPNSRRIT